MSETNQAGHGVEVDPDKIDAYMSNDECAWLQGIASRAGRGVLPDNVDARAVLRCMFKFRVINDRLKAFQEATCFETAEEFKAACDAVIKAANTPVS